MDSISTNIRTLICDDSKWISRMTSYPKQLNNDNIKKEDYQKYFSKLKDTFDEVKNPSRAYKQIINSENTYNIIKILLETQGIRAVHPVWFFIHEKKLKDDGLILNPSIKDDNHIITIDYQKNAKIKICNKFQKLETLNIYYTILKNDKIRQCFIDPESAFILKFKDEKELDKITELKKYFYFPSIEENDERFNCFIDISYKFDNIIDNINIEINEPGHNKQKDFNRAGKIFYTTGNRIIQYYVNEEELIEHNKLFHQVIPEFFFLLTKGIFIKNKYAGLVFNAFIKDIISNLFIAIFCSELKKESTGKNLTFKRFVELCNQVKILITLDYIKIIEDKLSTRKSVRDKELNEIFYDFKGLNENALLKDEGSHYYLMKLEKEHTPLAFSIAIMYAKYVNEHDKLFEQIMNDNSIEKQLSNAYTNSDEYIATENYKRIMNKN